jgi:hypothetical protein
MFSTHITFCDHFQSAVGCVCGYRGLTTTAQGASALALLSLDNLLWEAVLCIGCRVTFLTSIY